MSYLMLRQEVIQLLEMRKRVAASKDGAGGEAGEAGAAATPKGTRSGAGARGPGPDDGGVGVRAGKRELKRKAPARYDDNAFSSPVRTEKRQRVKRGHEDF